MFVCVVTLSQPSSRDMLYVKCVCVLSRCLSPIVEICYMLSVCVLSRDLSPVVDLYYPLWDVDVPYKNTYKNNSAQQDI